MTLFGSCAQSVSAEAAEAVVARNGSRIVSSVRARLAAVDVSDIWVFSPKEFPCL